jgi:hypothetical protein
MQAPETKTDVPFGEDATGWDIEESGSRRIRGLRINELSERKWRAETEDRGSAAIREGRNRWGMKARA